MKESTSLRKRTNTKTLAKIGLLAAVSVVVMMLKFPLFFAPPFYKLDFSEVPVLIGAMALGPVAGAAIELVKVLLNFVIDGTTTGGVGELANFLMGCSLVVPASMIYQRNKTFKGAVIGIIVGIVSLTIIGAILNYFLLLPVYSVVYNMPIQAFVDMGNALNSAIVDLETFVLYAVVPFNLLKGVAVSAITLLVYKKLSPILQK